MTFFLQIKSYIGVSYTPWYANLHNLSVAIALPPSILSPSLTPRFFFVYTAWGKKTEFVWNTYIFKKVLVKMIHWRKYDPMSGFLGTFSLRFNNIQFNIYWSF